MKKVLLLFTVFLSIEVGDVFAQSPGTGATVRKATPPPLRGSVRSRRKLPPPPPLSVLRRSRRGAASASAKSQENPYAGDPGGRIDMAGKPVGFYPSSRSINGARSQTSATRTFTKRSTAPPKTQ